SFLTKLVKSGVTSRAKTAATGLLPFAQTGHAFLPADLPVTLSGLKTDTESPACGPDFRSAPSDAPANRPTTAAESRSRFMRVHLLPRWDGCRTGPTHTVSFSRVVVK